MDKKVYLYLIPTICGKYFKFGISKSLNHRINSHKNKFNLNTDKGLIIESEDNECILMIEKMLKRIPNNDVIGFIGNGYTEIRSFDYFILSCCIIYVQLKNKKSGFSNYETCEYYSHINDYLIENNISFLEGHYNQFYTFINSLRN